MIAHQRRRVGRAPEFEEWTTRRSRFRRSGQRVFSPGLARPSSWQLFLDDRRAIRFKWGLLVLFLLAAALLDLPL